MSRDEIEIPKQIRPFMMDAARQTNMGYSNGAIKQYRYGNLHIREFQDKYLVHTDKVDPLKNPIGHLIFDAPEILVGLASGIVCGSKVAGHLYLKSNKTKLDKQLSIAAGLVSSLIAGYLGYRLTKKIKGQ